MSVVDQIQLSCLLEATCRKPGNVHPAASFTDLCYDDFVLAAGAIAEPLSTAQTTGVGQAVLAAIRGTRSVTKTNVNLGIALLLAPLVAVPNTTSLQSGVGQILHKTTVADAEFVYEAIRLAQPGGLGTASSQDVSQRPTLTLRDAMLLAADRDRIAEQYASDFQLVFTARDRLIALWSKTADWEAAIIATFVWILAEWPDTLIARKCGWDVARQASQKARGLLDKAGKGVIFEPRRFAEFDDWLRADGHRRNPGTTADLIAATLFAGFRDGLIPLPSRDFLSSRDEVQARAAVIRQQTK